jgi:hypothetical protein
MRELAVLLSAGSVVLVGAYCGYRFQLLRNYLLGYEWYILAISSACGIAFSIGHMPVAGSFLHFFDLFSRLFGIPLIAGVGLLRVTHDYEPPKVWNFVLFAGSVAISVGLFNHPRFAEFAEPIVVAETIAYVAFTLLLLVLTYQCFKFGLTMHGFVMLGAIAFGVYTGAFGDFLELAPDDNLPTRMSEFVLAHLSWSVAFGEIYLVYVALAKAKGLSLTDAGGGAAISPSAQRP